jgi:hypothetical protein
MQVRPAAGGPAAAAWAAPAAAPLGDAEARGLPQTRGLAVARRAPGIPGMFT